MMPAERIRDGIIRVTDTDIKDADAKRFVPNENTAMLLAFNQNPQSGMQHRCFVKGDDDVETVVIGRVWLVNSHGHCTGSSESCLEQAEDVIALGDIRLNTARLRVDLRGFRNPQCPIVGEWYPS